MPSNRVKPRERQRTKKHPFNSSTSGIQNNSRSKNGGKSRNRKKGSFKKSLKTKKKNSWRFFSSDLLKNLAESDRKGEEESLEQESTIVEQDFTVISKKTAQVRNTQFCFLFRGG